MSSKVVTVSMSSGGEIRISDGNTANVFSNAMYAAEELARLIYLKDGWNRKSQRIREELTQAEKIDATTVDLISNVRKILDDGVPF